MSGVDRRERLTGRLDDSLITARTIPRLAPGLLDRLRNVPDTSSAVSDALDELGRGGCVPPAALTSVWGDDVVVGQSVTLRYRRLDGDVSTNRGAGRGRVFGDRDLYGLAEVWSAGTSPQAARYRLEDLVARTAKGATTT